MTAKDNTQLRRALEKSLDVLGEPSKKSLLFYLEQEFDISFRGNRFPRIEEIESALRSVLGQGAHIITHEMHRNLERGGARPAGKKNISSRQSKSLT